MNNETCLECGRTHRLCRDCNDRPVTHRIRNAKTGLNTYCRPCQSKRGRASKRKKPDHYRRAERLRVARSLYGLTEIELDALGRICHLCGEPANCIDHCHETGRVRGLLCQRCNTALGLLRDDSDLLRRAADYVERHSVNGKPVNCVGEALHPDTDELVACGSVR